MSLCILPRGRVRRRRRVSVGGFEGRVGVTLRRTATTRALPARAIGRIHLRGLRVAHRRILRTILRSRRPRVSEGRVSTSPSRSTARDDSPRRWTSGGSFCAGPRTPPIVTSVAASWASDSARSFVPRLRQTFTTKSFDDSLARRRRDAFGVRFGRGAARRNGRRRFVTHRHSRDTRAFSPGRDPLSGAACTRRGGPRAR